MDSQFSIWPEKDLDKFFPIDKEKRKSRQKEMLLERYVLSDEEERKYDFVLEKESLVNFVRDLNCEGMIYNPGIPQMVLTTLGQYFGKPQDALLEKDMFVFQNSIERIFGENVNYRQLKIFRKENNLSFFGKSQYDFIKEYLKGN